MTKIKNNFIQEKIANTPELPGVYLLKNKHNIVIYIGKSKNLKKRLKHYFISSKTHSFYKNFLEEIYNFEYIIVDNQYSALILERNLIKERKPKFNILMTDDKEYPYIQITNEKYPRILYLRKINKSKGKFYGPFPDGLQARKVWKILNKTFPLRKCNKLPRKKCIYYYIGQCYAPCTENIDSLIYLKHINDIENFFKGNTGNIIKNLNNKLNTYSENREYEKANKIKHLIKSIDNLFFINKTVEFHDNIDRDVIGYFIDNDFISLVMMNFRHGKLLNMIEDFQLNVGNYNDIIETFIVKCYGKIMQPKLLVTDVKLSEELKNKLKLKIILNKKLIENANKNAKNFLSNNINKKIVNWKQKSSALDDLSRITGIKKLEFIELYDNSHISQTNYVSAIIIYQNGEPKKSLYRKYKLGNKVTNDISAFQAMILKRFNKQPNTIPDLIIVDGGKAQVNIIKKTLSLCGFDNIIICGLIKDTKHRTDALLINNKKIKLDKQSPLFLLLYKMQADVHKFAINFFINQKSKSLFYTKLNDINGVGKITIQRLVNEFKSYEKIKNANLKKLETVVKNKKISLNIFNYFNNNES